MQFFFLEVARWEQEYTDVGILNFFDRTIYGRTCLIIASSYYQSPRDVLIEL